MLSYTLWVALQNFAKWKTLLRYISVVSFISIAFVVVKLKTFKFFRIDSVSIKWPLLGGVLGPYSPKYCLILLKFWPEVIFHEGKYSAWKILQNFEFWFKWNTPKVYSFGPFWVPIYKKPKILLETKISAKTTSLGKSNNVSSRSPKDHRIVAN